ncbi:MAG: hypothetical protein ACI4UY_10220 [Kiritimatiellia bacterium]
MALEIERKYLVNATFWQRPEDGIRMRQGSVAALRMASVMPH